MVRCRQHQGAKSDHHSHHHHKKHITSDKKHAPDGKKHVPAKHNKLQVVPLADADLQTR